MKNIIISVNNGYYPISINNNFKPIINYISEYESSQIFVITDSNVNILHFQALEDTLKKFTLKKFIIPAGEQSKSFQELKNIYNFLIKGNASKKDIIIAFGGGVIGDLAGFAAATFLSGLRLIQVPTSLLSQVDSSVGGKTALNFLSHKNNIGLFYQPIQVFINTSLLTTLPEREFNCGMGEVLVHSILDNSKSLFTLLTEEHERIKVKDSIILNELVYLNCNIKRKFVEEDEYEHGKRQSLNLGHTIGHAIESLYNFELKHGECVSLGLVAACYISLQKNIVSNEIADKIIKLIELFNLPTYISSLPPYEIIDLIQYDKKRNSNINNFILIKDIGEVQIVQIEDLYTEIIPALNRLQKPYYRSESPINAAKLI